MSHFQAMLNKAKQMLQYAYSPYSNFQVAACLRSDQDMLFAGCNIENASYSLTLCAEASALASLVSAGHRRVTEAVIISNSELVCAPCGACRQRLLEFSTSNMMIHMCNKEGLTESILLSDLLPKAFNADHLAYK